MDRNLYEINDKYRDILDIIRCKPGIEKTILAKKLDIAYKTLIKQLEELETLGFIISQPELQVNGDRFWMCGISVGGSHCKVTIVDAEYKVLKKDKFEKICKEFDIFQQDFFSDKRNKTEEGYKYFETPDDRIKLQL